MHLIYWITRFHSAPERSLTLLHSNKQRQLLPDQPCDSSMSGSTEINWYKDDLKLPHLVSLEMIISRIRSIHQYTNTHPFWFSRFLGKSSCHLWDPVLHISVLTTVFTLISTAQTFLFLFSDRPLWHSSRSARAPRCGLLCAKPTQTNLIAPVLRLHTTKFSFCQMRVIRWEAKQ